MAEKVRAIVIRGNDKKEKDVSVLLFSLEKGKIWATLRGVKAQNAKLKLAAQPFCFGDFLLEEGRSIVVTGFDCVESFHEIAEDVDKYFAASAVMEVVDKLNFVSESERAAVFVLTLRTLKGICFLSGKNLYVLNKFLIEINKILGVPLGGEKCSCCGSTAFDKLYINYSTGELVCTACKTFDCEELSRPAYMALKILSNTDFEKLGTLRLAAGSEMELLKILVKNFERRFDQSLKFMGIL